MRKLCYTTLVIVIMGLIACGNDSNKRSGERKEKKVVKKEAAPIEVEETEPAEVGEVPASKRITLDNKGVGSIKHVELSEVIDQEMVGRGMELFKTNCSACHKVDKRFIGPSPKGIMKRRSPEWTMNMILNPQLMVEQDRCAKDLLVEFNGAAMSNQNMTKEQARDILEYFRTLD